MLNWFCSRQNEGSFLARSSKVFSLHMVGQCKLTRASLPTTPSGTAAKNPLSVSTNRPQFSTWRLSLAKNPLRSLIAALLSSWPLMYEDVKSLRFQGNAYTKDSLYSNCSGYKREMTRSWHDLAKGSLQILKPMDLHHNKFVDIYLPKW